MKPITLFAVLAVSLTGCAQPHVHLSQPTLELPLAAQIVRCNAYLRDFTFNSEVITITGKECLSQSSPNFTSCIMAAETMNYVMDRELHHKVSTCARAGKLSAELATEAVPVIKESELVVDKLTAKFK